MKKLSIFLLFLVVVCCGCHKKEKVAAPKLSTEQQAKVKNVQVSFIRYEQQLFSLDPNNLSKGVEKLYGQVPEILIAKDSWKNEQMMKALQGYLADPTIKAIYKETQKQYGNLSDIQKQLEDALKIYLSHFPDDTIPTFYTMISGLDFSMPSVWEYDQQLFVNLDMYLGKDFKYYSYAGMPRFIAARCERKFIATDCFTKVLAYKHLSDKTLVTVLDNMVDEGKKLFFTQTMFPDVSQEDIIGYSKEKYEWAKKNEAHVWQYFMEKNVLYSKDEDMVRRFIDETPFTREFGNDSPGRIGSYIGWHIVQNYMRNHPETTLKELMLISNAQEILKESYYKPGFNK